MTCVETALFIYKHHGACLGLNCGECFITHTQVPCSRASPMYNNYTLGLSAYQPTVHAISELQETMRLAYVYIIEHAAEALAEVL